jgi:hypothetical protein
LTLSLPERETERDRERQRERQRETEREPKTREDKGLAQEIKASEMAVNNVSVCGS